MFRIVFLFSLASVSGLFAQPTPDPSPGFPEPAGLYEASAPLVVDSDPLPFGAVPDWTPTLSLSPGADWDERELKISGVPSAFPEFPDYTLAGFLVLQRVSAGGWAAVGQTAAAAPDTSFIVPIRRANERYHFRVVPLYEDPSNDIHQGASSNIVRYFFAESGKFEGVQRSTCRRIDEPPEEKDPGPPGDDGDPIPPPPPPTPPSPPCAFQSLRGNSRWFRNQIVTTDTTYYTRIHKRWEDLDGEHEYDYHLDARYYKKDTSTYTRNSLTRDCEMENKTNGSLFYFTDTINDPGTGGRPVDTNFYRMVGKWVGKPDWEWEGSIKNWVNGELVSNYGPGVKFPVTSGPGPNARTRTRLTDTLHEVIRTDTSFTTSDPGDWETVEDIRSVVSIDRIELTDEITRSGVTDSLARSSSSTSWNPELASIGTTGGEGGTEDGATSSSTETDSDCGQWLETSSSCAARSWDEENETLAARELAYRWYFDRPVAPSRVRWSLRFTPRDGGDSEIWFYRDWTGSNEERSPWYKVLLGSMPYDGSYCVRQYTADLSVADFRGWMDRGEQLVDSHQGTYADPAGATIYVDQYGDLAQQAVPGQVKVELAEVPGFGDGSTATLTWKSSELRVFDSNEGEVFSPHEIDTLGTEIFTVRPAQFLNSPPIALSSQVDLVVKDESGMTTASDHAYFHLVREVSPEDPEPIPYSIPFSDATGPRYRKIGLTGRPLGDSRPQAEEGDESPEETYVDAFNLNLRHSVTDIYIPIPGSELSLSIRRNVQPEIWDMRSGLRPHERIDLPFGAGWSSNVASYIQFVEPSGPNVDNVEDPAEAFVTDEAGNVHHFVRYEKNNDIYYVPMPSGAHDKRAFLTSLREDPANPGGYVFRHKHGNTLFFDPPRDAANAPISVQQTVQRDRLFGSADPNFVTYRYVRLAKVQDRLGYSLLYDYKGDYGVIPFKISAINAAGAPIPDQQLYIQQEPGSRVTAIWDPRGTQFVYNYGDPVTFLHPHSLIVQEVRLLSSVSYQERDSGSPVLPVATYGYNDDEGIIWEPETVPSDAVFANPKAHINVTQIRDGEENEWTFEYAFDRTRLFYSSAFDQYFPQHGQPRWVSRILLPKENRPEAISQAASVPLNHRRDVQFENNSLMWLDRTSGELQGGRSNSVIDAEKHRTDYDFLDTTIVMLPKVKDLYFPGGQEDFRTPRVVYYEGMKVTHGELGHETYSFSLAAGLALSEIDDFSGNKTTFLHEDQIDWATLGESWFDDVYPDSFLGFGFFDDPTSQINAHSDAKSFTYGPFRILETVTDEEGRVVKTEVDAIGRRVKETRHAPSQTGGLGTILQETELRYENAAFPGVLTQQIEKRLPHLSDEIWVASLRTDFTPDSRGRIEHETRYFLFDADSMPSAVPVHNAATALVTTNTYDLNNNRTSVKDPRDKITVFRYDGRNRLVTTIYNNWDYEAVAYNLSGRKTRAWAGNSGPTVGQNPLRETFFYYDGLGRLIRDERVVSWSSGLPEKKLASVRFYNGVGSLLESYNPRGHLTRMEYDALQRLVKVTGAENNVTQHFYDGPNSGASAFESSGFKPTRTIDPRGFITEFDYDALYRLRETRQEYERGIFNVTGHTYDKTGNLTTTTDDRSKVTKTEYDDLGRPVAEIDNYLVGADLSSSDQSLKTQKFYTSTGLVWKEVDAKGIPYETHYDGAGRPVRKKRPPEGTTEVWEKMFYDAAGNIERSVDPRENEKEFVHDDRNRATHTIVRSVFDEESQAIKDVIVVTGFDSVGNPTTSTDGRNRTTISEFDGVGRVVKVIHPDTTFVRTEYDGNGNPLSLWDERVIETKNAYDRVDRLTLTVDGESIETRFEYDRSGNRTVVTDGLGQTTRFEYDGLGRLTAQIDPARRAERQYYDGVVQTRRVDAAGRETKFFYDGVHRLQNTVFTGASAEDSDHAYDRNGNLVSVSYPNQDGLTDVFYSYDDRNRIKRERSAHVWHEYRYDLNGNRTELIVDSPETDPDNGHRTVEYSYDKLNRLDAVLEGSRITNYYYDLNGNARRLVASGADTVVNEYNDRNRLTRRRVWATPTSLRMDLEQDYDDAGNLTWMKEVYPAAEVPDREIVNTYDDNSRLLTETVTYLTGTEADRKTVYVYDAANNRTWRTISHWEDASGSGTYDWVEITSNTYTYNNLNQLTNLSEVAGQNGTEAIFTYDIHGNRIRRDRDGSSTAYRYDRQNRLVEVLVEAEERFIDIHPGTQAGSNGVRGSYFVSGISHTYRYDHRTRRIWRSESAPGGGTEDARISFAGGVSVAEFDGAATTPVVEYVRGQDIGGGVGGILYSLRGTAVLYSHYNHRGDVIARTDATGSLTYAGSYEAFGTRLAETGSNPDRQRANSKEEDPTGLLNEGFRYRDLETGVFLTRDPLGFVDGPNLYTYVSQNPWSKFDPLGLWETGSYFGDVGQVFVGYKNAAVNTVTGVGTIVAHPIQTAKGVGNAALHPVQTFNAIKEDVGTKLQTNAGQGEILGDILIGVATGGAIKATSKTGTVAKLAENVDVRRGTPDTTTNPSGPTARTISEGDAANNAPAPKPRVNKLEPVQDASGPHTSFKTNQQGKVTGYETYDKNPHTGQFGAEMRFRGEGGPHGGVEPPFVLERAPDKGPGSKPVVPRPATPEELPNGY